MDSECSPKRISDTHLSNELSNLQLCLWPAALRSRFPPPIRPETRAMPTDRRLRLDDRQSTQHTGVPMIQPGKFQTVDIAKSRLLRRPALQNIELVAKRQDLDFQRSSRSEQSNQPAPNQFAELDHSAEVSPDSRLFTSRIRFATGTGKLIPAFLSHPALGSPDNFCEDLRFIPLDAMCELTAARTTVDCSNTPS